MNIQMIEALSIGLLPVMAGFGIWQLKRLIESVDELNKNVAVVISRVDDHSRRINNLEQVHLGR